MTLVFRLAFHSVQVRNAPAGAAAIVSVLLCLAVASAEPAEHPAGSFAERTWSMHDGLPEQVVQAFAQTGDRYLWIGTTGGLLRFDGARFVLYNRENTAAFSDNNIFCLKVARDNTLWIGSEGGGLIRYRDGIFHAFSGKDGLTNGFVRSVYQDSRDEIWVGTDNGLFEVVGDRLQQVDGNGRIPALAVHAIYEDSSGGLWVGGSRLLRIAGDQIQEFRFAGEPSRNRVKSIWQTKDGDVWVGTVSGLQRMRAAQGGHFESVAEVQGTVRVLRQTSDGTLWAGTIGHGLYLYRAGHFSRMTAPLQLPSNTILNLLEDIEQNIWVGTQAGMLQLGDTPVSTVALPDASDSDAETVYEDRGGEIWIAAANLFRFQNGRVVPHSFLGINGVRIRNLFRDRDGLLWIGTEGQGVYHETPHGLVHYSTGSGLVNNFIRAFLQARDGSVWIATDEGVSRWTGTVIKNYQVRDGLCYFSTRSLLEDGEGNIWIGTDRGVSLLGGDTFQNHPLVEALKNEKVWAMHQDPEGGLWFGTRTAGVYRWRSGKLSHFTTANGLASNSIYELIEDPKGMLWMSGPNGISQVRRGDLEEAADNPSKRVTLTLYGVSEGLEAIQMCGGEKPAGLLTRKGEVWFPSSRGPMRIRIDQPRPADRAPVVVDQVVADGVPVTSSPGVALGPEVVKLELRYGVVQLRSQERVRFRYKLDGFDRDWSEPTDERIAHYTNLPPGHYKFRVAAFEMNNPEETAETSLAVFQRPHFYETAWFLTLCVLTLVAAIWSVHKFHLAQLRERFRAVLNERTRLAREMHDTLIQGCVSVSALLEAYLSFGPKEVDAKQDLMSCARTQLRTTIDEAREAVWNLRQKPETGASLGPFLQSISEQVHREHGIPVEFTISGQPFEFQQDAMHELLMVVREAIHNAVRHGQPSTVEIGAHFTGNKCVIAITDDGCGFDPTILSSASVLHYGILGMKERMQKIEGTVDVKSKPGGGTEVTLQIPKAASSFREKVEVGITL